MPFDKLLHGGDYNPEQWLDRPDILAKDVELMEKAHVNVVTLGVFCGRRYGRCCKPRPAATCVSSFP